MKALNFLSLIALVSFFAACANQPDNPTEASAQTPQITGQPFGDTIVADGAVSYEEMLMQMTGKDSLAVKVVGEVESVCQKKGCWMNIVSADPNKAQMFVQFKDYGFFMPKDIKGRKVIMDGFAYKSITPVEELRHYAEDEGKSKEEIEAITEPLEELKFMASGVLLLPAEGTH
ncbi:MAG: DUF4920 domain-containing protein [Saprospiraceae bacterium]|nr:DUF4920 domain-containing protein [Saprospiraceae bacterium]